LEAATLPKRRVAKKAESPRKLQVRALGALLRYLDSARIGVEFEPLNVRTPVTSIKTIVVDEMVEIDKATYYALDIFAENKKAERSYRHGAIRPHSAVSLFSLCNRCKSGDCNLDITAKIYGLLGSMRSMKYILNRLRSGTAKVKHWESLYKMISNAVSIGRYMEASGTKLSLVEDDIGCFGDTLAETMAVLGAMIDFRESLVENRIVVNSGVDPELDRAKELYRRLPGILTQVAQDESKRLQADTCSVAYVPMIGYLLAVPYDFNVDQFDDLQVILLDRYIRLKSFEESKRMRELDEELGDVKMKIIDKETTITIRMSSLILSRSAMLLGVERVASSLDAAISLALTARQLGTKNIKERERHEIWPRGRRQVGLLVFLAHIGSFVPAEVAHIGMVKRIFSRIYTVDSVLDGMSTFASDLNQVSIALRRGNERSLVIIDEFGKGTMTEVGLSLLASTISYWAAKGQTGCPHVFVSSHFHALPNFVTDEQDVVSYHTMEVRCRGAELDFQYRLVDGVVDSSYAAYIACKMGIPYDVGDRAKQVRIVFLK
ncbi:MutS domain V protein, partial [Cooperia oncophora]